ncbi:MAG: hypothetical protein OXN23_08815 [Gammaproteobacteria bacterium]|nr:hypothetical protein [Gammaproteobacteria bacterium]
MNGDIAKIQIKMGGFEIAYEGDEAYLKKDIFHLIEKTLGFYTENRAALPTGQQVSHGTPGAPAGSAGPSIDSGHSTNTIATILAVESGPDLIIAASVRLVLIEGQESMSRKEILTTMKSAAPFYKRTYNSNLSQYLERLVRADRLRLVGKDTYTLSPKERKVLEEKLAKQE